MPAQSCPYLNSARNHPAKAPTEVPHPQVRPLVSLAQTVLNRGRVVLERSGSYIGGPSGQQRIRLKQRAGLHTMRMWISREQASPKPYKPNSKPLGLAVGRFGVFLRPHRLGRT